MYPTPWYEKLKTGAICCHERSWDTKRRKNASSKSCHWSPSSKCCRFLVSVAFEIAFYDIISLVALSVPNTNFRDVWWCESVQKPSKIFLKMGSESIWKHLWLNRESGRRYWKVSIHLRSFSQMAFKRSPVRKNYRRLECAQGRGDSKESSWGHSIPAGLTTSLTTFVVTGIFQR